MDSANHVFKPRPPQNIIAQVIIFSDTLWESTSQVVKYTFTGRKILLIKWAATLYQRAANQLW